MRPRILDFASVCCAILLLACAAISQGQTPEAQKPFLAEQHVSAAELVKEIISDESKVDDVRSLYLRLEGKIANTPEGIAARIADLQAQFPGLEITSDGFRDLRPETSEELELAFDEKRLRKLSHQHDNQYQLQIWDGTRAVIHEKHFGHAQEHYAFDNEPQKYIGQCFFDALSWLRMAPHSFWFFKQKLGDSELARVYGNSEDFAVTGESDCRGHRCLILENRTSSSPYRLYVGKDDHRLYGRVSLFLPTGSMDGIKAKIIELVSSTLGRKLTSETEINNFIAGLSEADRREFDRRTNAALFEYRMPLAENYLDDYRKLAQGIWFPAKQGYRIYGSKGDKHFVAMSRDWHLVEARVNEPLADNLFKMEFEDGVEVNDWGHDPPLHYKYKADRTPAEWQKILDAAQKDADRDNKSIAARDALIGKPAPDFPKADWLHSKPLTWESLHGKVVMLLFWAHWCAPCHNDLPLLAAIHDRATDRGIVAIGVHSPGSDQTDIENCLTQFKLQCPIVIDVERPDGPKTWGMFAEHFGIDGFPYAIVVDQSGNVAGHGSLNDMLDKANTLVKGSAKP